ncbi:unnamed protein product [Caenorhabditis auriculariae]|uniref:PX domain-containing protein n=1 Tax=Caenorhabditis auriculariae TaxID=2777116 RepID=A0A8S1H2E2_9PELO|nr:unnamed protein product [Caenorhabditis auriculariae]
MTAGSAYLRVCNEICSEPRVLSPPAAAEDEGSATPTDSTPKRRRNSTRQTGRMIQKAMVSPSGRRPELAASPSTSRSSKSPHFFEDDMIYHEVRRFDYDNRQTEPESQGGPIRVVNAFSPLDQGSHQAMIHIGVADTQTFSEKNDSNSKYVAYNLDVNGWFHASIRFRELHQFAETIKQKFGQKYKGPEFPPKKLFKLDERAVEERQNKISKYFGAVVQHPDIESFRSTSNFVSVDVYNGDGERTVLKCRVSDNTNDIMKLLSEKLGLPDSDVFLWHFGLFMARSRDPTKSAVAIDSDNFDPLSVRLLRNFESPYISLQTANQKSAPQGIYHFLTVRKIIWSARVEEPLLDNEVYLDLIYRQAKQDYKNGHFDKIRGDIDVRLTALMQKSDKLQFVKTCHLLPTYSYEIMTPCLGNFPKINTPCDVKIGRRQIVLSYKDENGHPMDSIFRATRVRIWQIVQNMPNDDFTFQFEYLAARDTFEWIILQTNQAVLMSLLFQSIGSEILYEHNSLSIEQQILREKMTKVTVDPTPVPVTKSKPRENKPIIVLKNAVDTTEDPLGVMESYRNFNQMYTTISDSIPQRNEAFKNITDDDL